MSPEFRLSTAQSVIVGARISKTGQAIAASGDLEGKAGPLPVGTHGVEITIDTVVR
jgi:cytochrome c-type biogenesis protein CcmH